MSAPTMPAGYRPGREWVLITNTITGRRTWFGERKPTSARTGDEWRPNSDALYIDGLDTYELIPYPT